jgi:hypothetical protein
MAGVPCTALAVALVAAVFAALPAGAGAHDLGGALGSGIAAPPAAAEGCPTSADPDRFAGEEGLLDLNRAMQAFGERPTASPNHERYVDWLERRLRRIPGMEIEEIPYTVDRWLQRGASLAAGPSAGELSAVPVANAVPYSQPAGASGELVHVPHGESLADHDVRGKLVVRDVVPGKVPNAVFVALSWFTWDPDASMGVTGDYERDYLSYMERVEDLRAAAEGGAAGVVFAHGFPREQVRGQYAPYEGERWKVPAVYVGVDEGERLKRLAAQGGSGRIGVSASQGPAETRTLVATLPGMSDERIVVNSHTDGMNAIWDNGPMGMLPLASHFAALPRECRPRTVQLVFSTAHLYQQLVPGKREGGAEDYATRLDHDYDQGSVALVIAMEHMGAREYAAVEREDGPGRELLATGQSEPTGIFVGESPVLVEEVSRKLVEHDLRRSIVLRGADLPGARIPPHHSFGGEGTPYHKHLIPTVGLVTGPWSLYNPAFGMEAIDGALLRRQAIVFTDLVHAVGSIPREALAGGYLAERQARSGLCALERDGFGFAECEE